MIGLDTAKEIIRRADPAGSSDRCSEVDSAIVDEKGWEHVGEDYFYHEAKRQLAGPSSLNRKRILVNAISEAEGDNLGHEAIQDISLEWERQAATEPPSGEETSHTAEGLRTEEDRGRQESGSIKCTCDT